MDVPLALNDIGIRQGLKGYERNFSTIRHKSGVVELPAFIMNLCHVVGYNMQFY